MTIDDIVQRIFRDYLQAPDDMHPQAQVQAALTDVQTTVVYKDELMPEEVAAISAGDFIEVDYELMRVLDIDESTRTLTVVRGSYGTTAAAHSATALIRFSPKLTQAGVFEAIADELAGLYPDLYAVGTATLDPMIYTQELDDPLAGSILSARQLVAGYYEPVWAEIVEGVSELSDSTIVQVEPRSTTADIFVRYSKRFSRPTSGSDTLASLGLEDHWSRILVFAAMGSLLAATDIDAATQEFITESLEAQGYPPGAGASLAITFARLRATSLQEARDELRARNSPRMHMRQVI